MVNTHAVTCIVVYNVLRVNACSILHCFVTSAGYPLPPTIRVCSTLRGLYDGRSWCSLSFVIVHERQEAVI